MEGIFSELFQDLEYLILKLWSVPSPALERTPETIIPSASCRVEEIVLQIVNGAKAGFTFPDRFERCFCVPGDVDPF